jgi:hypothetical protein
MMTEMQHCMQIAHGLAETADSWLYRGMSTAPRTLRSSPLAALLGLALLILSALALLRPART